MFRGFRGFRCWVFKEKCKTLSVLGLLRLRERSPGYFGQDQLLIFRMPHPSGSRDFWHEYRPARKRRSRRNLPDWGRSTMPLQYRVEVIPNVRNDSETLAL